MRTVPTLTSLREVYGLKPKDLDLALGFLDFLETKNANATKGT